MDGLYHNTYSLIVLPYKPDDYELTAVHYCSETLMFYLPKNHKYAKRKALHFHEMDGENMLVYHNTGSWDKVIRSQMPNTHFIIQTEAYSLTEVIENSILPCFISNLSPVGQFSNRVAVPIRDDEARAEYYLVCKNSVKKRFDFLLKKR